MRLFPEDATMVTVSLRAVTSSLGYIRRGAQASGLILSGRGNQCLSECCMKHEASPRISMGDGPPPEV